MSGLLVNTKPSTKSSTRNRMSSRYNTATNSKPRSTITPKPSQCRSIRNGIENNGWFL